jgi:palmitoyltransferase ZDHHC13/17
VNTIYFLLKKYKFNINQGDKKLSTALHWAAFLNKENSLTFLLAWGADPNIQDIDHNTPLHLSVILSCKTGNTRNVKLLLLKGASRDVINNDDYKPIDLVNSDVQKAAELKSLLQNSSFLSCCMLRAPLTKLRKNERTVVFFLILVSLLIFFSYFYIIPTIESNAITILSGVLAFFILLSFTIVTLKDPGYLKKERNIDFQILLDTLDPLDICPECEIILTPRCRHCNI